MRASARLRERFQVPPPFNEDSLGRDFDDSGRLKLGEVAIQVPLRDSEEGCRIGPALTLDLVGSRA
jgi:hypothetical protein